MSQFRSLSCGMCVSSSLKSGNNFNWQKKVLMFFFSFFFSINLFYRGCPIVHNLKETFGFSRWGPKFSRGPQLFSKGVGLKITFMEIYRTYDVPGEWAGVRRLSPLWIPSWVYNETSLWTTGQNSKQHTNIWFNASTKLVQTIPIKVLMPGLKMDFYKIITSWAKTQA